MDQESFEAILEEVIYTAWREGQQHPGSEWGQNWPNRRRQELMTQAIDRIRAAGYRQILNNE